MNELWIITDKNCINCNKQVLFVRGYGFGQWFYEEEYQCGYCECNSLGDSGSVGRKVSLMKKILDLKDYRFQCNITYIYNRDYWLVMNKYLLWDELTTYNQNLIYNELRKLIIKKVDH